MTKHNFERTANAATSLYWSKISTNILCKTKVYPWVLRHVYLEEEKTFRLRDDKGKQHKDVLSKYVNR